MRDRGRRINTIVAILVLASAGAALAQTPTQTIMDRNRVILLLQDNGEIGSSGSSVAGGGFWLALTNQYIFSSGPNLGATIASPDGGQDTVLYLGGPFSQVSNGSLEFPELGEFWDSTIPFERENMPAPCRVDDFRVSEFPSLQPFAGQPFPGFADQTVCVASNDITGSPCTACNGFRAGVEVVETMFSFGVPSVQDFVFVAFRVFNRSEFVTAANTPAVAQGVQSAGPYDLQNAILAIAIDPDIGNATDDQISFLPDVQTMVFWDNDFSEPQFQGTPGFGGISYLKTPINPETGEEAGLQSFSVFANGSTRPDPNSKEEWYQVMTGDPEAVLFEITPTDVRGMASSGPFLLPAGDFVEIYAAYFFANVSGSPPSQLLAEDPFEVGGNDDPAFDNFREVQLTAQATFDAGFVVPTAPPKPDFELIPGEGQVTIVWEADPVETVNPFAKVARDPFARLGSGQPDPDADGRGTFLEADQVIFAPSRDQGGTTGFVTAATAGLTGREVTNAAFDPDFVIQDFQGFNVYRSLTGLASDAELIAQFDLADGIVGGTFCTSAAAVFDKDDGGFESAVCTAQQAFNIGTDSGLAFAVTDRGGSFPDPSTGPGLINGIPIFYTVTSFAVNTGQSPVDLPVDEAFAVLVPSAAPLVLEAGLAPLQQVTPRSNASSFTTASLDFTPLTADGSACDDTEPTATVDEETGKYVDFVDCSTAVAGVNVVSARDANLPTGEFLFVVDSILPNANLNPYVGGYALATGFNDVWFHWERAGGGLATEISPTVGSFTQNFTFGGAADTPVFFGVDTDMSDTGVDLGLNVVFASDFSVIEDLEVNGRSLHLEELGGEHGSESRPHSILNSELADFIHIGNVRSISNAREYSHPGVYGQGGTSYELTWESGEGGGLSGTLRKLPGLEVVPEGGQPKGPENSSTPGDFIAGYNWGFVGPSADPTAVQAQAFPAAAPLTNDITLSTGDTFVIFVPGQSVYIQGLRSVPQPGDVWTFLIDTGSSRAGEGREGGDPDDPDLPVPPFSYADGNDGGSSLSRGIVNVYPGARWRLTLEGGSNELADADLSEIRVVPNPFIASNEITRGNGLQRILFTNIPPQATIRIYTISGNLVRVLEHTDGSGTEAWDVRTRFDLLVASGNYYFHVTTPDGRTHLGRFAVVN